MRERRRFGRALAVQGVYYLTTGLWPLVSIGTFEAVTGPKTDRWLVKTVGLLTSVIGANLLLAGRRRALSTDSAVLAAGSACALAAVEVAYATRGRISKVYLVDALAQLLIVSAVTLSWRAESRFPSRSHSRPSAVAFPDSRRGG